MQYVRSLGGSVSKTWNSINPATLSGAIDVVVVEQEDGSLACSPFHVRFGKFSLLRPSDKKVEFRVNGQKQDYSMKLGDGGEAFFVFETTADIPVDLQTSPVISPAGSPQSLSQDSLGNEINLQEPDLLDLTSEKYGRRPGLQSARPHSAIFESVGVAIPGASSQVQDNLGTITPVSGSPPTDDIRSNWSPPNQGIKRASTDDILEEIQKINDPHIHNLLGSLSTENVSSTLAPPGQNMATARFRSQSPPPVTKQEAINRAITLSKKLSTSNIRSEVNETGDLMLDMEGYKSAEADALRAEMIARKVLAEELQGNYDIGALIGADERGNLWIYSSEEAKEAALRRGKLPTVTEALLDDAASDPGHQSDDERSITGIDAATNLQNQSSDRPDGGLATPPQTPEGNQTGDVKNYAKTLRLTSDQLKALSLKPGRNPISFTVNRATCQASIHYWNHKVPVVISDIDGTITKSDALGHVLNMLGRDWTHPGVAKLFTDITANGYNIMYLTSRSVGQADTTRAYLEGIVQEGIKLPMGPVILSPDRTMTALRREVYLRKPEVFKMSCLRDIASLFGEQNNPFYAGFGNRITDALSYRSVKIPQNRIFTINPEGSVAIDILTLNNYKSSYISMRELVPHFFPPIDLLVKSGGENFTDFSYWRSAPLDVEDFTDSEEEEDDDEDDENIEDDNDSIHDDVNDSEDEGLDDDAVDQMTESYMSRESMDDDQDDLIDSIIDSIEETDLSRRNSLEEALDAETPLADPDTAVNSPSKRGRERERTADF